MNITIRKKAKNLASFKIIYVIYDKKIKFFQIIRFYFFSFDFSLFFSSLSFFFFLISSISTPAPTTKATTHPTHIILSPFI